MSKMYNFLDLFSSNTFILPDFRLSTEEEWVLSSSNAGNFLCLESRSSVPLSVLVVMMDVEKIRNIYIYI